MSFSALFVCCVFIAWLFLRERRLHPMTSSALWIPLLWIGIIGSKAVSYWLGAELDAEAALAARMDGSPVDRAVFLVLIIAGVVVLVKRRIDWRRVLSDNLWLFLFFLYCALSIAWSDHPFISTKRWIKDVGNMIMVLIIVTDRSPAGALKGVVSRYIHFAIPVSLLLITFFPDIGTHQDPWTETAANIGITTNKNELGIVLVTCGLFLIWDLLEHWNSQMPRLDLLLRGLLLAMNVWLLAVSGSATALVCFTLGTFLLLLPRLPFVRRHLRHAGLMVAITVMLLVLLNLFPALSQSLLGLLGRDLTLTGRTEIWSGLLREPVNPLIGSGYMNFWVDSAVDRYGGITQAHNGYLETYLNGGLIGLALLLGVILLAGMRLRREVLRQNGFATLMFLYLVIAAIYNWTEAMFNGLSLIWFILLVAVLNSPRLQPEEQGAAVPEANPAPPFDRMAVWYRIRNQHLARNGHGE